MHEEMTVEVINLTSEQILAGNMLIAQYMNWQHHSNPEYDAHEMRNLKYHTDWNSIMPVVVKLQEKHSVEVWINYRNTQIEWSDEDNGYDKIGTKSETKLLSIFNAVVRFLTWVNENEVYLDNPVFYE